MLASLCVNAEAALALTLRRPLQNYANDVATCTFAQPGRGSGACRKTQRPCVENTCAAVEFAVGVVSGESRGCVGKRQHECGPIKVLWTTIGSENTSSPSPFPPSSKEISSARIEEANRGDVCLQP